ncbi:MAG TPA: methyltransferase [Pyrinomonadaceae bacterium]|jgi:ubiquinone/menaquinone biosynthesis C-methylase UbiE/acyl carrier protein|nr:methyltransferase [Pyrinomonadaceae bacterium]
MRDTYQRIAHLTQSQRALLAARLNGHPRGTDSQPSGPSRRLVAYIVRDPQYADADLNTHDSSWSIEQVSRWRDVYENLYAQNFQGQDPAFNLTGWESTYTGQPIPDAEMREQVEQTAARLLRFAPRRVLEIGCGTGLILFRVAPSCESYVGTDFSTVALEQVRAEADRLSLKQVKLLERTADDFSQLEAGAFDTVVLNSVVQYFPNAEYLYRVLSEATRVLAPGGRIFLGDVRSLPLLETFHLSVALARAADSELTRELRQRVRTRLGREEELALAPQFFLAVQQSLREIRQVEVQPKGGWSHNELTAFRYDVMLQVGGEADAPSPSVAVDWHEVGMLEELRRLLAAGSPQTLIVRGVPSARLWSEVAAAELLNSADAPETIGEVREILAHTEKGGIEPQALWDLGQEFPYQVTVGLSGTGREGLYDVLFRPCERMCPAKLTHFGAGEQGSLKTWKHYANNPLQARFAQRLAPQLRKSLREQLPDYMVPASFVLLDAFPLTPNGKVDQRAMPAPDGFRPEFEQPYVMPRTPAEKSLAAIWCELLGLEQVGAHDNFFTDLGGHSLLATQLVSRVRDTFKVELPLRRLFETPTISELAVAIEDLLIELVENMTDEAAERFVQGEV